MPLIVYYATQHYALRSVDLDPQRALPAVASTYPPKRRPVIYISSLFALSPPKPANQIKTLPLHGPFGRISSSSSSGPLSLVLDVDHSCFGIAICFISVIPSTASPFVAEATTVLTSLFRG
ncbi:hypothetical protein VUR80DRAFT_4678 [Thermomyces stellatus]